MPAPLSFPIRSGSAKRAEAAAAWPGVEAETDRPRLEAPRPQRPRVVRAAWRGRLPRRIAGLAAAIAFGLAAGAAYADAESQKMIRLFAQVCESTLPAFVNVEKAARANGFSIEDLGADPPFVGFYDSTGIAGSATLPREQPNLRQCEVRSDTVDRSALAKSVLIRLRDAGRSPQPIVLPDRDTNAWVVESTHGSLFYLVSLGMNDDPVLGATLQVRTHLDQ